MIKRRFLFVPTKSYQVNELQLSVHEFKHGSGSKLYHLCRDDSNSVFAVGFRTPVQNSFGTPHILEHMALCGSKKYPVRDPFFKMLNRTLATYMNAMTADDYTIYPFSTLNVNDYNNLLSVYLDAVFNPNLDYCDFAQEGWRLEHENLKKDSPVVFKGVVYNEMKGVMSDNANLFSSKLQQQLFPESIYSHISGGDPLCIPSLKHQDLKDYHAKYYHPSNATFFVYGGPSVLQKTIDYLTDKIPQSKPMEATTLTYPTVKSPVRAFEKCGLDPSGDASKQTKMCVSFVTNDIHDAFETISMRILSSLLLCGSSSPMQQALIESGLAPEYSPVLGYDSSLRKSTFTIGVQGIDVKMVEKIENVIQNVLIKCSKEGFPDSRIKAALHQAELSLRHVTANFGMNLMLAVAGPAFHGVDLSTSLRFAEHFERMRKEKNLFQDLITKYLILNQKKVILIMSPDQNYQKLQSEKENELLESIKKESDLQEIYKNGLDLNERQSKVQDLQCLPCLNLLDISKQQTNHEITKNNVFVREANTNGIGYIHLLKQIPLDHFQYLSLFCSALKWQGTSKSMNQLDNEIKLYTGGLDFDTECIPTKNGHEIYLGASGSSLEQNYSKLVDLMQDLMLNSNFLNHERLQTLINSESCSFKSSIVYQGHKFAQSLASSMVHSISKVNEEWNGLTYLNFLKNLNVENTAKVMEQIKNSLKNSSSKVLVIGQNTQKLSEVASNLVSVGSKYENNFKKLEVKSLYVPLPIQVYYSSSATLTVPFEHPDSMALQVAAMLLTNLFLHGEIREKGGAYGAFATMDPLTGVFSMTTYRDPNPKSIDVFQRGVSWIMEKQFSDQELLEAKLRIFAATDAPIDASREGLREFQYGHTHEQLQMRRDLLFKVTNNDVIRVSRKYLNSKWANVVLGPKENTLDFEIFSI